MDTYKRQASVSEKNQAVSEVLESARCKGGFSATAVALCAESAGWTAGHEEGQKYIYFFFIF